MQYVYVVIFTDHCCSDSVVRVFSTRESAEEYLESRKESDKDFYRNSSIEEYVLED